MNKFWRRMVLSDTFLVPALSPLVVKKDGSRVIERIRVMISSRCNDDFPPGTGRLLSDVRRRLKTAIEDERFFGEQLFEVWINEDEPPADYGRDAVEHCLAQARRADLVLVLYNGHAGWTGEGGTMGICHQELQAAFEVAPSKVYAVHLLPVSTTAVGAVHEEFRRYVTRLNGFRGSVVMSEAELIDRARETLAQAVSNLLQAGTRNMRRGSHHLGEALDWSRMSMPARKAAMEAEFRNILLEGRGAREIGDRVALDVDGRPLLLIAHGVPGPLTLSAAREMVGQPFLRDHEWAAAMADNELDGPVHVILCQKGATETQARKMLGFPDATIVGTPFGVYAADPVQKIQLIFLAECCDPSAVRSNVKALFEWLDRSGERAALAARAEGRRRLMVLLAELQSQGETLAEPVGVELVELAEMRTENGHGPIATALN